MIISFLNICCRPLDSWLLLGESESILKVINILVIGLMYTWSNNPNHGSLPFVFLNVLWFFDFLFRMVDDDDTVPQKKIRSLQYQDHKHRTVKSPGQVYSLDLFACAYNSDAILYKVWELPVPGQRIHHFIQDPVPQAPLNLESYSSRTKNFKVLRTNRRRYLHYCLAVSLSSKIQYHKTNPIPSLSSTSPLYLDTFSQCSKGSPVLKSSILLNSIRFPIPIHATVPQSAPPTVTIIAPAIIFHSQTVIFIFFPLYLISLVDHAETKPLQVASRQLEAIESQIKAETEDSPSDSDEIPPISQAPFLKVASRQLETIQGQTKAPAAETETDDSPSESEGIPPISQAPPPTLEAKLFPPKERVDNDREGILWIPSLSLK